MTTAPVRPTRRPLLHAILAVLTLAVSTACATGGGPAPSPAPAPAPAPAPGAVGSIVMVIRHAEKPDGSDPGVDAQGNDDPSSLTATGWDRANKLVDLFDPAQGAPRPGLARPAVIYAAGANDDGEGLRPRETVTPLAGKLGLQLNIDYGKGDEKKMVEQATSQPGPALISWQHEEIPDIAKAFPSTSPKPPSDWPDNRFDVIWTFTKTADGWAFAQQPQLLLPDDSNKVIKN